MTRRLGPAPTLSSPKHLPLWQSLMATYLNLQLPLVLLSGYPAVALSVLVACSAGCSEDCFCAGWRSSEATQEVRLLCRAGAVDQVGFLRIGLVILLGVTSSTTRPRT